MRTNRISGDHASIGEMPGPMIVRSRPGRSRNSRTVSFQWYDGAGEMHYHALDPIESGPFLTEASDEMSG